MTRALCGLSHLNVWWMGLGIQHQRIRPASPQENGAHERMHRTLKREAIRPPKAMMRSQQRVFDAFRTKYNEERPQTHHGGKPPGSQYDASPREYPSRLPALEYAGLHGEAHDDGRDLPLQDESTLHRERADESQV